MFWEINDSLTTFYALAKCFVYSRVINTNLHICFYPVIKKTLWSGMEVLLIDLSRSIQISNWNGTPLLITLKLTDMIKVACTRALHTGVFNRKFGNFLQKQRISSREYPPGIILPGISSREYPPRNILPGTLKWKKGTIQSIVAFF